MRQLVGSVRSEMRRPSPSFLWAPWLLWQLLLSVIVLSDHRLVLLEFRIRDDVVDVHLQPERILRCLLLVLLDQAISIIWVQSWRRFHRGPNVHERLQAHLTRAGHSQEKQNWLQD